MRDIIICSCSSTEHQVVFKAFDEEIIKEVYMDIHLVKHSFWQRLKYGLKYIFGYKSRYGAWDEIILDKEHAPQLEAIAVYLRSGK